MTAAGALLPLVPFAAALIGLLLPRGSRIVPAALGIGAAAVALAVATVLASTVDGPVESSRRLADLGDIAVTVGVRLDPAAVLVAVAVGAVALAVQVYSVAYLRDDDRYAPYAAQVSLFTAAMLTVVVAGDLVELLVGWEVMGICSYLLIGHDRTLPEAPRAAVKAFLVTRVGDVGFLLAVALLGVWTGSFRIADVLGAVADGRLSPGQLTAAALLLLAGVAGKSAQFPLHTWLPDAMAGPTPVSALIHAATMVVAGVYLIARLYGVFYRGFSIAHGGANLVSVIGAVTLVIAAVLAFVQDDIKKVLAYSTVSQLGYMVMALGVGAWTAGIFHLFTHAFFKALLFLGAGSVSHAVHSFDMKKDMGGLRKHMPVTFWTFIIGSVALAGIPPLAGFWSKDEILLGASRNGYPVMVAMGFIGAFMTAAYMTRCCYLTFFGHYRGHGQPHESPPAITVPLGILAVFSVLAGLLNAPGISLFRKWTTTDVVERAHVPEHAFAVGPAALSVLVALIGIGVAYAYWFRDEGRPRVVERSSVGRGAYRFAVRKYYLDDVYTGGIVGSVKGPIAAGMYWFDQHVIDATVDGVATVSRAVAGFVYDVIDQKIVDGLVNATGATAEGGGGLLRIIQTGRVQQYAAILFGAVVIFAAALVLAT